MNQPQMPLILTDVQDRVMTIRLNRADKKNALTQGMYTALEQAVTDAANNPQVRVVLFAGSGGSFCAGNDLQDFVKLDHNTPREQNPVLRFMAALAALPKPVVAAVQGPAVGIGATLLFHCDLVYAGSSARFQFPFVNIGICAEFASTYLLPRMVGHVKAAELLLLGEPFTAAVAEACGIINSVMADEDVEAHAMSRALKLASQPPNALRVNKMLMKRWTQAEVTEAIPLEADHFIPMLRQPEAIEAMTAFIAKRKPDFSNFN
ncbi:enoyl-CoA hydratase [Nevskia sp.]|uniref:enoyl-CoA hydratase n=1 Tax=Nevskia sp. TaxID=1929292 RepID=UPI0025FFD7C6|nr:enoyl-CoA hydratase [Nevskia sp.]